MTALHRQPPGHPLRHAVGCAAPAATLHWIVAAGFLLLAARYLLDPLAAFPGRELIDRWWLLEVTAIWSVPAAWFLFRIPGAGSLLVTVILPLLALTALTIGVCSHSPDILRTFS